MTVSCEVSEVSDVSSLIAELRAHIADRDQKLNRLANEKDRLSHELAAERRHARDLADRLDQAHRERLAEAVRRWRAL